VGAASPTSEFLAAVFLQAPSSIEYLENALMGGADKVFYMLWIGDPLDRRLHSEAKSGGQCH
jgi:hypothetical protein